MTTSDSLSGMQSELRHQLENIMPDVISLRRHLHRHPELSGQEEKTAAHLVSLLNKLPGSDGLDMRTSIGGHGLLVRMDCGAKSWIVLRADMDALPIDDGKQCVYASQQAHVAHACGHDAHSAMLYGAIRILLAMRDTLHNNIAFIFQPAEETTEGAAAMLADGVIAGMSIERIHALHVYPYLPAGTIGLKEGTMCAAADMFDVEIEGRGGHAARPHECIDVILITSHIIQALHHIVSRRVNPLHPAVLTIGQIHAGSAANVIPGCARFSGTVRSLNPDTHEEIRARMDRIIRQTAETWGATARFHMRQAVPMLVNDSAAMHAARHNLTRYLPDTSIIELEEPSMGGEDFAEFLQQIPGCLLRLGTGGSPATRYPLHHPCFDIDETSMHTGVATLAALALNQN
ncbi:MAG: amidohydrolase [Mariprofundaceae bacterium]|nr:amidohydrolase [Mariprofundaceae bacterium]